MLGQEFKDPRDGQIYKTVRLLDGNEWFGENLRFVSDDSEDWASYRDNRPEQRLSIYEAFDHRKYGRLYSFEGAQQACPPGWRVPTAKEWHRMLDLYGGYVVEQDGGADEAKRITVERLQTAGFAVMPGPVQGGSRCYHHYDLVTASFWSSSMDGFWNRLASKSGSVAINFRFGYCVVDHGNMCSFRLSVRCVKT